MKSIYVWVRVIEWEVDRRDNVYGMMSIREWSWIHMVKCRREIYIERKGRGLGRRNIVGKV